MFGKFTFQLEDVRTAAKLYKKGDFVVTFDLKSGYHHIDMAEEHWKYLCFEWKGKFYCFRSLPFGLSTAPHLFNKMVNSGLCKPEAYACRKELHYHGTRKHWLLYLLLKLGDFTCLNTSTCSQITEVSSIFNQSHI